MKKSDVLKSQFASGKIGRREFVQGVAALGVSAAAATSFIKKTEAATPLRGGHARIGISDGATADSMSVATWVNNHQFHTGMGIHDYLTVTAGQSNLVPHLAETLLLPELSVNRTRCARFEPYRG